MAEKPMTNFKLFICWSFLVSAVRAVESDSRIDDFDKENLIEYHYRYAVDDSQSKGPVMDRWEQRIGEYVKGAYSVVEPDGRVRTVDYEVDGKKGYHAVIRMNEPGPDLLSYQQLSKSIELFPEAVLPVQADAPSKNLSPPDSSTGKAWNYHSDTPYVQKSGQSTGNRHTEAQLFDKALSPSKIVENLPLGPANFNVPQTTNVIYYEKPGIDKFHEIFQPISPDDIFFRNIKREVVIPIFSKGFKEPQGRRRRNSKLVRRYKSFLDVIS